MKRIPLLFSIISLLIVNTLQAQHINPCGTDVMHSKLAERFPEFRARQLQLEEELRRQMYGADRFATARTADADDTTVLHIPVVVHIIHDYENEYIPDDSVYIAVKRWNEVFINRNADTVNIIEPFKPYIGNARIQFHLATKDPDGSPTKGITRRKSFYYKNNNDYGKLDGWPQDKYMNIWVVNTIEGGPAGYARYPVVGGVMTYYDGLMLKYDYLGYAYTTQHEIGHYLSLWHVFGDNATTGVVCGDDGVDDTPPTKGHGSTGCRPSALYDTACATGYMVTYRDINGLDSIVDYPDTVNAQNVMDYTYCDGMFTKQQAQRMRSVLHSNLANRNNLHTEANQLATGIMQASDMAPIPDISVEKGLTSNNLQTPEKLYFSCAYSDYVRFRFKNRSWNDTVSAVQINFSNGAGTASSGELSDFIINSFTQPGWITATVTATGNNTASVSKTFEKLAYVADTASMHPSGYVQNFGSEQEMEKWPLFNYYDNAFKWELFGGTGFRDNSCLRYTGYDNRTSPANKIHLAKGDYDDVISPAFNLSEFKNNNQDLNLNFYTSGAYRFRKDSIYNWPNYEDEYDTTANDRLQVLASANCGASWSTIGTISAADLLNNGRVDAAFIPGAPGQWVARTINIPNALRESRVYIKFRYRPEKNSNYFYLDQFGISPYPTVLPEIAYNEQAVVIYPNPVQNGSFTLSYKGKAAQLEIYNYLGQKVLQQNVNGGSTLISLGDIAPGIYMYKLAEAGMPVRQGKIIR